MCSSSVCRIGSTTGGVTPQNMTVNNDAAHNYLFTGGAITATEFLLKQGTGTLTFANDATFTGGVTVLAGPAGAEPSVRSPARA